MIRIPAWMKCSACLLWACLFLARPAAGSTKIDLDGDWQFRADPKGQGQMEDWSKALPGETKTVRVPNTWNVGEYEDYEGIAWYFKTFKLPPELKGKHLEIHFGATFYRARVWLNGVELGSHEGGHTSYFFVLPANNPRTNFLAVAIDNRPTETSIPGLALRLHTTGNLWYDWWHYGGIVRDVWLTVNDSVLLRQQHIRVQVQQQDAVVTDRLFLENVSSRSRPVNLRLSARFEGGDAVPVAKVERKIDLAPGAQELDLTFRIPSVRLWHFDQPNLYDLAAEVVDASGKEIDSLSDHFGARTVEIKDNQLYLNGEPVRLTGMTRHEDSPWEGLAETRGTWLHDYDDMKNLQVVLTRPVHYPQPPEILDYCDRHGILLVPEIPLWQFGREQLGNPAVRALAKQMFREMVDQDFNHPSIFAWSVCNECEIHAPEGIEYVKEMRDLEKSLDPDRFVTFADDLLPLVNDPSKSASQYADFLMWNQYLGTWHGPAYLLPSVIDHIHATFPNKMVIVSEFGFPDIFASNPAQADEMRARVIQDQLAELAKHPWIAGAIFWCYQDYRSHRNLAPGLTKGYVEIGLVDKDRQRRPSYYVWRDDTSPVSLQMDWKYDAEYPHGPVGFHARIARRAPDELPSYALHGYRAEWEIRATDDHILAQGEKELGEVGPPVEIAADFAKDSTNSWTLRIRVCRPTGFLALERQLVWVYPRSGGEDDVEMKRKGTYPANPPILETAPPEKRP
ncbi:MAG: glycoside hydrolase family 2 TIM barrel-domain containing protein [Candidatus Acidiferrales bacterium]